MNTNRKLSVMLSVLTTFAALAPMPACAPADEEVSDVEAEAYQAWAFVAAASAACLRMPACRKLAGETVEEITSFLKSKTEDAAIDWLIEQGILSNDPRIGDAPKKKKDAPKKEEPKTSQAELDCIKNGMFYKWGDRHDVTMTTAPSGAQMCSSERHNPCAGPHVHGERWTSKWRSGKCVESLQKSVVKCDGELKTAKWANQNWGRCGTGGTQTRDIH